MKKALLIIGMIIIFFAGCKKDDILEASRVEMKDVTMERGWEHVKVSGEYSYPQALEGMKIIVSSNEDMGESVEYVCALEGKKFDVTIDNLEAGVTYYYRYEYDNGYDKARGDKANFVTVGKPIVVTNNIVNVTKNSAVLNGSVTNNDVENKINARGFCWSKNANPTISGSHNNNGSSSGTGTSSFTYNLSYLESNTKYYVRAYAKTDWGVVYGEEKNFVTMREEPEVPEEPEIVLPTVTTNSVTNITSNSATCGGNVTSDGNGTVTARGICWSETSEPKINNLYSEESNEGTGTGSFTSSMTNLKANTTYYVRAYATNEAGTSYGDVKSFVTLGKEPEETISGTENGHNYVDLGLPSGLKWATCNVGASTSTDYGHYYAWGEITTKTEYTEDNSLTYGLSYSELQSQGYIDSEGKLTAQYDAATANWGGTWRMPTKAEQKELLNNCTWTWTTQNGVNGYNVEGPNGNSIFLPAAGYRGGSSLSYAGSNGVYWSSTPDERYRNHAYGLYFAIDGHYLSGNPRNYGLSVRPVFGGNFEGPDEQPEIVLPTVTTNSVTNITSNSATCSGNVTSDGNGTVTARGICWSETSEPKINNLYSEESNEGTGTGSFTSSMTNLKANTTYYVRAYATNEAGTVYGEVKSFKTLEEEPEETISGTENGHNYVDLGLPSGLKWATCNVGASTSTDYGHYYAWGETTTKTEYTEDNSLTYGRQMNDISGNSQYDAATANWGGSWRMPKSTELKELIDNCTWTWTIQNGVNGYKVIGTNGNSIFLPAAGLYGSLLDYAGSNGSYWSSTPIELDVNSACDLIVFIDVYSMLDAYRYLGRSVRPVFGGNFEGPEEQPEEPETPSANQTFNVNGVSFTMIAVEGGTFKMGAQSSDSGGDNYDSDAESDESPVHDVTLSSYYIGETEVTQELWEAVMGSNPSFCSGSQKPVEQISWNDCQEFITKLNELTGENFRLPTEAEWEYAARGGNKSQGYKYSGGNTIGDVAWYTSNNSGSTHDVKTKQANELGIYDMSGNVWEWCQDWYGSYSSSSQTDPTGPTSGVSSVFRGGSCGDGAWNCRVSNRSSISPDDWGINVGFRLSLSQ